MRPAPIQPIFCVFDIPKLSLKKTPKRGEAAAL